MNVQLSKILIPICNAIHFLNCLPLIRYLRILIYYLIEFIGRTVCISLLRSIHDHGNVITEAEQLYYCVPKGDWLCLSGLASQTVFFYLLTCCCCRAGKNPDILIPKRTLRGLNALSLERNSKLFTKRRRLNSIFLLFGVVYSKRGNSLVAGSKRSVPKNITSLKRRLKMTQEMILNRELECRVTHIKHTFIPTRMSGTRIKIGYKICHEVPKSP